MANKTTQNAAQILKKQAKAPVKTNPNAMIIHSLDSLKSMIPEVQKALAGTKEEATAFVRSMITAVKTTPLLGECTTESFLSSMLISATLKLTPNTPEGHAYLIPFKNRKKGVMECQFVVGYKGLVKLAWNSGMIERIDAQAVYENDEFEYALGWDAKLNHIPAMSNRGNVIGYYGLFRLKGGGGSFIFMSKEDVEEHARKYSKSYNYGPWKENFDAMAKKTALIQVFKYAPLSREVNLAVGNDGGTKNIPLDEISDTNILEYEPEFEIEEEPKPETEILINRETGEVLSPVEEMQEQLKGQDSIFTQ